mgnify:CR=1 FL=1
MEKISMQKIIQMLQDDKSHIPVDKLTMMQKYGMIEYAFINQPELIPQVMRLLTMHAASRNEQKRYIDYFFLTLKQQRDVFPFEMLEYHNISHCFDDAQITKFFQIVKDRIGNRIFTYDQLLTILEKTILPKYVKGIHPKKDFYHIQALQIQKQIYRQIQHEMNLSFLEHKMLLSYLQELPHQYGYYLNQIKDYQKSLKK